MKAVKANLSETKPDRVAAFEKEAAEFAKKIVGNFKDYEFYVGESMNPEGMVALLVSCLLPPSHTFWAKWIIRTTERTAQHHTLLSGKMGWKRWAILILYFILLLNVWVSLDFVVQVKI
jgi:hypothetical protein